jgi:hypothetical protein
MNTPLNDNTQQNARELARKITVAHDLDPEIQKELYGHEDKLLAYKSGEERISDEDAFILVREHFGDAKVLRSMFAEVHEAAATLTLGRLIGAACIITLSVAWLCKLLALPFQALALYLLEHGATVGALIPPATFLLFHAMVPVLPIGVAAAFIYWRKRLEAGKRPWFYRWSKWDFLRCGALLFAAIPFTPSFELLPFHALSPDLAAFAPTETQAAIAAWIIQCSVCVAWLWWCGADLRRPSTAIGCVGGWMALFVAMGIAPAQLFLATGLAAQHGSLVAGMLAGTTYFGDNYIWIWRDTSLTVILAGVPALLKSAMLYPICSLVVYFFFSTLHSANAEPKREFKNWGGRFLPLYMMLLPPAWTWMAVEKNGWTDKVWIGGLLHIALLAPFVYIRLVSIPRAIADRKLYRLRALGYASTLFLMPTFFVPNQLVNGHPLRESLATTVYLAAFCGVLVWMATMAIVNWRKRDETYSEPEENVATPTGPSQTQRL